MIFRRSSLPHPYQRVWGKAFRNKPKMKVILIIKCTQCGGLMMATQQQKSKICPYCGEHIELVRAQKIASASNAYEASAVLRKLKNEQGFENKR